MKHFVWLLFLPGFLCNDNPLTIRPDSLVAWKGSCVVIPCQIGAYKGARLWDISLLWYFQPYWVENQSDYSGDLLYNISEKSRTQTNSASRRRVDFIGDINKKNCSLKIPSVMPEDSGIYGARIWGSVSPPTGRDKWFLNATLNVAESPPDPTMEISPRVIRESSTIRVTCSLPYHCPDVSLTLSVSGLKQNPWPPVGTTNIDGKIQTVVNFPVTWEDHGKTLVCSLKRQRNEISKSTMQLDVKYAPKGVWLKASPGRTLREGVKVSLECIIKDSNPPVSEYHWYKDDQQMYEWMGLQKLEFETQGPQHSGAYRCEAHNNVGPQKSEQIKINIEYPPKEVKVDRLPQTPIKEGEKVDLLCSSKANPPITRYEWYKQPRTTVVRVGKMLQFDSIQPEHAGSYYCRASNGIGRLNSSVVFLDVLYAPKDVQLIAESNQLPIKEGDTFELNCSFSKSNPSHDIWYNWYKAKTPLRHRGNPLTFQSTKLDEAGAYRCEVCNSVACSSSSPITVDIHFAPKDVRVVQEPGTQIYEGSRVTLRCEVAKANPRVSSYRWYKDGEQQLSDSADGSLTISFVTSEHSGRYRCDAQNSVAVSSSQDIQLNVYYGPRKVRLSLRAQVAVTEGTDATLLCAADANPPPRFEFYRDEGKMLENLGQILVLRKVQLEDAGDYYCRADNGISAAESQTLNLAVSYGRATKLKHGLMGAGIILSVIIVLGVLTYSLKRWKKKGSSRAARTQQSGSFFVRKPENQRNDRAHEGAVNSVAFQNGGEEGISYATLHFPARISEEQDGYSRVQAPRLMLDPSKEEVVYSVVKKPLKGDSRHDYENVMAKKEEELHYSSLVNLAPRPRPTCRDSETDSESEESIQYAALKH